ncbi:MAG TPA: lamin tail domain-containing protein [Pyrinomonadaceae bacterium]|nr:lamin tail domain-containing protein [Pyrinomonadaceae bacterium]
MPRYWRFLVVFLAAVAVWALSWQSARTQSPLRRITNTSEEGINLNPSLSGDGRTVAFESTEDIAGAGDSEAFRAVRSNVSVDPATFVQIAAARAPAPAVSQDGSRIAFASKDDPLGTNSDGNSEIFLYDGVRLIQVTNTSPGDIAERLSNGNFQPSISDEGRFIAFSSNRDLTNQNADGNLEIFVYDSVALSFVQLTNSSGIVGAGDAKISGDGATVAYIGDAGLTPGASRDLLLQDRVASAAPRIISANIPALAITPGRSISDDGRRVVWSATTSTNSSQVFLFDGRNGNTTRQITTLGTRVTDVPLNPTISGDGTRIAFATRRSVSSAGSNSDGSVELYIYDISSGTLGRVTNVNAPGATADVVSSMNDDGSLIAFNFSRLLSGPVSKEIFENDCEIYLSVTPARPTSGDLMILNGASFGHEPSTINSVAPNSIAVARGRLLSFTTQQSERLPDGTFPTNVGGTTVTVNGRSAQIFFVSPAQVNFLVPAATELGSAEVIVTNSDGFQSRGMVTALRAAPGIFTFPGDGTGEGVILNADTLERGPFDPTSGHLRLIIFSTGVRDASQLLINAGGRTLDLDLVAGSQSMPGMDEVHLHVPPDLRGAGAVDLTISAGGRDSNAVGITFSGDPGRDLLINEFLADPPDSLAGDANHDGLRSASEDEFVEVINTTTNDLDIGGYRLLTRNTTTNADTIRHTFSSGTVLPACSAIVVFGGGNPDTSNPAFGGAQVVKASAGGLSLTNSSGAIILSDPRDVAVNFVSYGGSTGLDANNNQSLTRSPDISGRFAQHHSASGGALLFSPGTQLNGAPFNPCAATVARVEVSPSAATIEVGAQQEFTARAFDINNHEIPGVIFSWESGNPSVAMIDQSGLAKGESAGGSEIRAAGRGVISAPALLTVKSPPPVLTSVTISPASSIVGPGDTQEFTAQAKDQTGQNMGGVTISFTSSNTTVATVDAVSPTSAAGLATAAVSGRASGLAEIRATATDGNVTLTSSAATLTVEPGDGQLVVSEFRTRGPAGAADEFVEIYNPTTTTLAIGGLKIRASNASGTVSDRLTIMAGKTIGPGCHYLFANNASAGYSGSVPPDQTYGTGITDDGGIAITGAQGTRIIDAVGMSTGAAFKEGGTLVPLTVNSAQTYERKPGGTFGNGVDTNNNATDFSLTTPGNPQNSSSGCLDTSSADLAITKTDSPEPVIVGAELTYTLTITNNGAGLAQNVTVTDDLPSAVTFVSCSSSGGGICGGAENKRMVTFTSLGSGAAAVITIVVRPDGPAGTSISNTATVTSTMPDPNSANNSATANTFIQAPLPSLSINDIALNEGNAGTTTFTFTVDLSAPAPAAATFDIATQDNSATTANSDYVAKTLTTQTIPAGNTTYMFAVAINADLLVEPNETFFVNVTNVSNATISDGQGQGTIQNDDTALLAISQVYGGGGNSGASYTNDFIEIFNRGTTIVDFAVTPYSVQYAAATSNFSSNKTDLTSGVLLPGHYFLLREASGGTTGLTLPASDAGGTINLAATAGKVALVSGMSALTGSGCPLAGTIVDFLGFGSTANCSETSPIAVSGTNSNARSVIRTASCSDTNNNSVDFSNPSTVPVARNTATTANLCP